MLGMDAQQKDDLFPEARNADDLRVLNERCQLRRNDRHFVVLVAGIIHAQYEASDRMSEAKAMVGLVDQGWASQIEVAQAFGCSVRTVRRLVRRFEEGGLLALARTEGYPLGRARLSDTRKKAVQKLKARGVGQREIARRMGVSEKAIRKLLRRMGWKVAAPAQNELPLDLGATADPNLSPVSTSQENFALSHDTDPSDRAADRLLARLGLLEDAPPLFGGASAIPRAGVLLAMPALVGSGVFDCAQKIYGTLGPSFYGLRTSLLTLLLMALWRIKRPEGLKEYAPTDLGRVLGLDRAPEVKTLRRKLAGLAAAGRAAQFGAALAKQRVAARGATLGFLYTDGHVRVYHGKHSLPKNHVARMRISLPATSDYWVNDMAGDPLFVITAEANAGLVKMLPEIFGQVRALVGKRRVTVVFDRGGYSPKLFLRILEANFDLLTYRKGRWPNMRRCPMIPLVKFPIQRGQPWTPNSAKPWPT